MKRRTCIVLSRIMSTLSSPIQDWDSKLWGCPGECRLTGEDLLYCSLLRLRQSRHTGLEHGRIALQILVRRLRRGDSGLGTLTWLTRLIILSLAELSGGRTSTARASAMMAMTLGRLLLLLPRMCWLFDSIKSAKKP